ncbi:9468_t:CDS:2 [Diversispora eburnea]|uniref:9468_t:CDS:1 n=1 Tax=Diversispora eburnea TaxID=1213867 RepID=A0A9N9AJ18_9GLOM|nr:9468_t:CDS:2 [Diversispora eburnea]
MPTSENDLHYMRIALEQAKLSEPITSAYCVGAVIVKNDTILATGYSRELPGNTHAEECKKCCVDRIKEIGIPRVVIGCGEPDKFVKCYGIENLKEFGIEVVLVKELEEECLKCNKHLGI